jgi:hypothetical protein
MSSKKWARVFFCSSSAVTQQVAGGVGLRVQIHDQGPPTPRGADGGQIARDGGFAHPPFLVEDDSAHGGFHCGFV